MSAGHVHPLPEVLAAWRDETTRLAPEILRDPVAHHLAMITHELILAATAELAALRHELDAARGTAILYAPDAHLAAAARAATDAIPGTVLHATDTHRELVFTPDHTWEPRSP